jgi:hypothetical protein
MATCPSCGGSSRDDPSLMSAEPTGGLLTMPIGSRSLPGECVKTAAKEEWILSCTCGWSVTGYIEDGHLRGV